MEVKSRISGNIIEVAVKVGDKVSAGQALGKLEAMKMEQPILSRVEGTVKSVNTAVGDKVRTGAVLFVIE